MGKRDLSIWAKKTYPYSYIKKLTDLKYVAIWIKYDVCNHMKYVATYLTEIDRPEVLRRVRGPVRQLKRIEQQR